ncbi:MAG: hypothetical protein IJO08_00485 [Clostridia bacterium]|nr:hypothetical protein [Clostridia bacterium]
MIVEKKYIISKELVNNTNEIKNEEILEMLTDIAGTHSNLIGNNAEEFNKEHKAWVVLLWKLKVKRRPRINEEILVKTWVRNSTGIYSVRDFEVFDTAGNVIMEAASKWCIMNLETRRPMRFDKELAEAYGAESRNIFEDFEKTITPEDFDVESEYIVTENDIDVNNHFHNANYLNAAYKAINDFDMTNYHFNNLQMEFKKEIMFGEIIKVSCKNIDEKKIIVLKTEDKINAIITLS